MTRSERLSLVHHAWEAFVPQRGENKKGERELAQFHENCLKTVLGAAVILQRDPLELARQLADGRLGEYLPQVEGTLPLPFEPPPPVASVEELIADALAWSVSERVRMEKQTRNLVRRFRRLEADLERRLSAVRCGKQDMATARDRYHRYRRPDSEL
jgi:hypothetical protein